MDLQSIKETVPKEIVDLCYYRPDPEKEEGVPVFPYVVAVVGAGSFTAASGSNSSNFDEDAIKEAFQKELASVAEQWNKKSKGVAPLVLLTGLSNEVEQIAAEGALEIDAELNVKVVAVLPTNRVAFRRVVANKSRFDVLLQRVHYSFDLSDAPREKNETASGEADELDSEILRRHALFLAVHSHVLFAIWNGTDDQTPGGAADAVRFKLQGSDTRNREDFLTYSSVGPVVQFATFYYNSEKKRVNEISVFFWTRENLWPSEKDALPSEKTGRLFPNPSIMTKSRLLEHLASEEPSVANVLEKLGQINCDSVKNYAKLKSGFKEAKSYLWAKQENAENNLDAGTRILVDHYLVADQLALLFQKSGQNFGRPFRLLGSLFKNLGKYFKNDVVNKNSNENPNEKNESSPKRKDDKKNKSKKTAEVNGYPFWVAALIFVGGVWGLFAMLSLRGWYDAGTSTIFFCPPRDVYWAIGALVFVIFFRASYVKYHYRYFRSRAAAEALRVQIFWRIAEMNDCVSGCYRSHQIDDSEWLRATISGLDAFLSAPNSNGFKNKIEDRLVFVRDVWVKGQLEYFEQALEKRNENVSPRWWESKLFKSSAYLTIIALGPLQNLCFGEIYAKFDNKTLCLLAIGAVCVAESLFAAFLVYQTTKRRLSGQKQEADRFKRMIFPYDRAVLLTTNETELSTDNENVERWHSAFRQLGAEAISENADWLLTVGERDLFLPR